MNYQIQIIVLVVLFVAANYPCQVFKLIAVAIHENTEVDDIMPRTISTSRILERHLKLQVLAVEPFYRHPQRKRTTCRFEVSRNHLTRGQARCDDIDRSNIRT